MTDPFGALLRRHEAFWNRDPAAEPILHVSPYVPLGQGGHYGRVLPQLREGDPIEPRFVDLERVGTLQPSSALEGPFFREYRLPGLCWTEAALGCPIRMESGGAWAEPFLAGRDAIARRCRVGRGGPNEAWLGVFREGTRLLAERAAGRFPVAQTLLRGPVDMMAAALGHEPMLLALLEAQQEALALLDLCTDLFIDLARVHCELVPPFHGGYVSFGLWSPTPVIRAQLDNAVLLSPRLYRESVLPADRRIFAAFDRVVIHVHSGCLHILDELLAEADLTAIQVSLDYPGGPLARDIVGKLAAVAAKKPLIVTGPVSREELELLRQSLPAAGVALDLQLVDPASGR